jgi:hypothetical protein
MFSDSVKSFLKSKGRWLVFISAFTLFLADPFTNIIFIPCWFKELTGLKCPACGGLRGLHLILHGQIWNGLKYNMLLVIAPFILWLIYKKINMNSFKFILPILFILLLFAWLRNTCYYPYY